MKDESLRTRARDLPPCSFSAQCVRYIDDLDKWSGVQQPEEMIAEDEDDSKDRQQVAQLLAHIPTCSTCTVVVAQTRNMREQQRRLLRDLLAEGQERVPSTTS